MAHADNTSPNNMHNSESKVFTREDLYDSLTDLNTGFDAPSIKHFSEKDFITVMNRCKSGSPTTRTKGRAFGCLFQRNC